MGKENKSYRIRTNVDKDSVVNFNVDNTVETLEILSLKINQTNTYKLMGSGTGIIAGRVLANGGFGVPNVKVSVFIEYDGTDSLEKSILYHFSSTKDYDYNGVRYNLLPKELDDECHQNIGTFPTKRLLLDNDNWIEVFDKYYKFTTRTNNSGDYMIYGVPTGMQTVHMDVDLSDIGVLSQKPRDLIYKGYNANMFESTTKFKVDTNLDSLAQVITQDQSIYVYPFWGDTTDSELNASITRCDMNINYKFEPTCVFMGSVITDTGENSMTHKCIGAKKQGKMSEMITGEGKIEMIRKTPNGQIEQFSVNGDNNINSDGIWCYQIPMNLDYVMHDEFGKMVMTDNPNTGLPTRARVRFRLSMTESPSDATARKRARFLIPNNPHLMESDYPDFTETKQIDYEFGTKTKDENFRDLFWNNVYTVKSYIPRLQKSRLPNNLRHLGIKMVNHSGGHNPMPFNNLRIKFNFVYSFLCTLVKVLVTIVGAINSVLTFIGHIICEIGKLFYKISKGLNFPIVGEYFFDDVAMFFAKYNGHGIKDDDGTTPNSYVISVYRDVRDGTSVCGGIAAWFLKIFLAIGCGVQLKGLCETDDGTEITVTPGTYDKVKQDLNGIATCNDRVDILYNCVENQLAQDNEVTSFNFYNDWINGVVYLPLWYRKIKKRRNGDIKKDIWCSTDNTLVQDRKYKKNLKLYATNTPKREVNGSNGQKMGTITPLVNNEDTVLAAADDETGAEVMVFTAYNDDNCYGYQCHKYSRTYFKVYKGLVFEKTTMLGDKVYYYKPCDYDPSTGNTDLVTLFATDLVLLGSLNDCDIHGIPQFFKTLESTTYNMPPDLLSEYYDYVNEDNQTGTDEEDESEIDMGSRMTEFTGADWGNLGVDQSNKLNANENQYDNGGLFYGLTCFSSYTKPKSCINLSRICELGVSLDESNEVPASEGSSTESDSDTLTPDGFISYDEIYNPDYRSMFATLNANFLRTKLNPETGLLEYDFNHMYLDNFDGSLINLMMAKTVNGKTEKSDFLEKANYIGNYNLEQSSDAYLNFRYGNYKKTNGNKIYFYESNYKVGKTQGVTIFGRDRLPRYENSFYFYFGLNEGKTAIDKFNNEFFSDCTSKFASDVPYELSYLGNSWCPKGTATDGYIAFNMNIDAPFNITFTNIGTNYVYYCNNINSQKIIFSGLNELPEEFKKYNKYVLTEKSADAINSNASPTTVPIMPGNGTYNITVTDAYDNEYEDRLVFELPRIGFVCDVNPFNCKNVDLLARFSEKYIEYQVGDVISIGTTYYELVNNRYTPKVAPTTITVTSGDEYYYKDPIPNTKAETYAAIASHGNQLPFNINNRDIYGFISISEVNEGDFRINLKPVNENFFGNDYHGASVTVHINSGVISVSESGVGYLGYMINSDDVTTYYFGVPYANQRYELTVTMLCYDEENGWSDSNNQQKLNVIVYEDEFKVYLNDIDYDLIKSFRGGWNDATLTEGGEFKTDGGIDSTYNPDDLYGWDDVLNIGVYEYSDLILKLKTIKYETPLNHVLSICEILSPDYEYNGTGYVFDDQNNTKQTPYTWTDEYCYNAPSTNPDDYYKGTIQRITYSYTIPNYLEYQVGDIIHTGDTYYTIVGIDTYVLYDDGETIHEGDTYYEYDYSTQQYAEIIASADIVVPNNNNQYYYKILVYDYAPQVAASDITVQDGDEFYYKKLLYDYNGTLVQESNMLRGTTYYTDPEHINVAVIDIDYIENIDYEDVPVTRYINTIAGGTYEAEYKDDSTNNVLATENYDGIVTINPSGDPNVEYNDLECMLFSQYRIVIDNINDVINARGELSRQVAGVFRINYDTDTILNITAKTKARPVKYLICGNSEITEAEQLYDYKPDGETISIPEVYSQFSDIDNTSYSQLSNIKIITEGYVVDPALETQNVVFKIPTLTYENAYVQYNLNDEDKHPYYISVKNDNNSLIPATDNLSNFEEPLTNKKNLLTTFGVHFYNKPLKGDFSIILSFINNIPAYPKEALGDDICIGFYHTIHQSESRLGEYEYTNDSELLSNTDVYGTVDGSEYIKYNVQGTTGKTVGDIKQDNGWNYLYNTNLFTKFVSPSGKFYNGDIVFWRNDIINTDLYTKKIIDNVGVDGENKSDYIHYKVPATVSVFYIAEKNDIEIHCIPDTVGDEVYYYKETASTVPPSQDSRIAETGDNILIYNSSITPGVINNYIYSRLSKVNYRIILTESEDGYKYNHGTDVYYYHGDVINYGEITRNWKPIDVFMPGFMCGYLYNGTPISQNNRSNIKAEFDDREINLYTIQSDNDKYSNINVKRLIYTDYTNEPTYGECKIETADPGAANLKYQYAEVPLVDDEIVYTDGYGDEYRYSINGTLNAVFDRPILGYINHNKTKNNITQDELKFDDYLITRTFYTSDNGYLRHQSLYYIFDLDTMEYPFYYYNSGTSQLNSNLKYNPTTKKFYFDTMPKVFDYLMSGVETPKKYASKSKSIKFNLSEYVRNKHEDNPLAISRPNDKFFVVGYCDGYYAVSPVLETQMLRAVYNYNDFNINDSYIYFVSRDTRDLTSEASAENGIHYIEDFYYLNYYRFTVHIATFDEARVDYNFDMYSQVCSIIENTAQKCYIKVTDINSDGAQVYWATALKIKLSSLGTEAIDENNMLKIWYNILVEDKSGCIRKCVPQTRIKSSDNLIITEFNTKNEMIEDAEGASSTIWYTTNNNTALALNSSIWDTSVYKNVYTDGIGRISRNDNQDIESIPDYGFVDLTNLVTIILPNSVTQIGRYAFRDCERLKSIVIPSGVTTIENDTFVRCSNLTSVTILGSVTSIGNFAFQECSSLTSITIPNSVNSIGESAFRECTGLTSIVIPSGVTTIKNNTFVKCYNLTSVTIPDSVTSIGNFAFYLCSSLTSITIPNSVTSIGVSAFFGCAGLTSIVIPGSINIISESAFRECTRLTSIVIPDSVDSIGEYAFYHCSNLTSITIPNGVTNIGEYAFAYCYNGLRVTCRGNNPPSLDQNQTAFVGMSQLVIRVPSNSLTSYKYSWTNYQQYITWY